MEKTLSILAFCPYYLPHLGGLEKYAVELHKELALRGLTITVFTPWIPREGQKIEEIIFGPGKISILRFPAWEIIKGYPLPAVWSIGFWVLLKEVLRGDFDVVMSTTRFFVTSPMAAIYSVVKRVPYIHIEHGSGFVYAKNMVVRVVAIIYDQTIGRVVFKLAAINVCPSLSAKKFVRRFDRRLSPVIYRGLPWEILDSAVADEQLREKFKGRTIITFAGRIIREKGVMDILEAVSQIPAEKYVLLVVGAGSALEEMKALAKKNRIDQNVIIMGVRSETDIFSILKTSDIVVNPSYSEGLPTVVLEAAALGRAIVATDIGGTNEIVEHNKTGLLFNPGNVNLMKEQICYLMDNKETRERLGQLARNDARSKFNWSKAGDAYYNLIASTRK